MSNTPPPRMPSTPSANDRPPPVASRGTAFSWPIAPAAQRVGGSAIRELLKLTERPDILSLAGGLPNPDTFPRERIAEAAAQLLSDTSAAALQYGPTEGYRPLREQIATRMTARGRPTTVDEVLITTGSQQALDLLGKAMISPTRIVAVSNPSYLGALQAFSLYQPCLTPFDPRVPASLPTNAGLCYLTPTFANPTGETLDGAAREALAETARCAIIEDDPYGELYFDAPPPPPMACHAPHKTAYLGSFSKVLAPGLRVGYVVAPAALITQLARLKQAADLHTASLDQRIVSALLVDGTLDRHLPAIRARYRSQRDALATALTHHLTGHARWKTPQGGMFYWLTLVDADGRRRSSTQLLELAIAEGVAFVPGAPFFAAAPRVDCLRLSFATLPAAQMDAAMQRLAAAVDHCPVLSEDVPAPACT